MRCILLVLGGYAQGVLAHGGGKEAAEVAGRRWGVRAATARRKALLCAHQLSDFPTNDDIQDGSIDVWWIKHDGGLLLLIAHLLRKHRVCAAARCAST